LFPAFTIGFALRKIPCRFPLEFTCACCAVFAGAEGAAIFTLTESWALAKAGACAEALAFSTLAGFSERLFEGTIPLLAALAVGFALGEVACGTAFEFSAFGSVFAWTEGPPVFS